MQVKSLQYLVELQKAGSMYGAAKRAMISQQGISKAVSSLEAELGTCLVHRTSHGTRLTEAGELVAESAKKIVAEHERMMGGLYALDESVFVPDARVNVHVSHYAAQIASVDAEYVRLLTTNTTYIEEPFAKLLMRANASDGSDLVFTDVHPYSRGAIAGNADVKFVPIIQTRYGFLWREGSAVSGADKLHRSDVCNMTVVLDSHPEMTRLASSLFDEHPLENIVMSTSNLRMLLEYVQLADADVLMLSDSFSHYIMQKNGLLEAQGLRFTPLATLNAMVQVGFVLPFLLRYGMTKATRLAPMILIFVFVGVVMLISNTPIGEGLEALVSGMDICQIGLLVAGMFAAVLVLYLLSALIAGRLYEKREL